MERQEEKSKSAFREWWLRFSLKQKIGVLVGGSMAIVVLSVLVNLMLLNFTLKGFQTILEENMRVSNYQAALEEEIKTFAAYMRSRVEENRDNYTQACIRTRQALKRLPFSYEAIGFARYAKTWNIRNSYETYSQARDAFILWDENQPNYVERLYWIYRMQEFEREYARNLAQLTLEEGNELYEKRVPLLNRLPYLLVVVAGMILIFQYSLSRMFGKALFRPVFLLAQASQKIARNDFSQEDLVVENQDEMGELVRAFNKMKHATLGYINTLEEKHETLDLLHKEEMEKLEVEKRLESTKLELLKSQLNPHFLFNTLNMIACMAKLEDADTTEQMITSMSHLFRYNLKSTGPMALLAHELKVVRDYMYIQQMRFGDRICYDIECLVDRDTVMIPTFTLQPIVENAVIHGISKKEQGGKVYIRVWQKAQKMMITVADTGVGMDDETLRLLREALKGNLSGKVGIGLGNIYKRFHGMYQEGELTIHSRRGRGTVVCMAMDMEGGIECTDY